MYDKSTNNDHHAEERMQHAAGDDEELIAQAPSQDCCSQCRESLGQPREDGSRPIDEVAPEMRGPRQRGAPVSRREPGE